jgi:hypothetical protein
MEKNLIEYLKEFMYLYNITWYKLQEELAKNTKVEHKMYDSLVKVRVTLNKNQCTEDGKWRITIKDQERIVKEQVVEWYCQSAITAALSFNKNEIDSFTITGSYTQIY